MRISRDRVVLALRSRVTRFRKRFNLGPKGVLPSDMEEDKQAIIKAVKEYTMTSAARVYGLIGAVDYVVQNGIEGDIVECGVWRGGSMLSVALRLAERGKTDRELWLYDTFEGMVAPEARDVSKVGGDATVRFEFFKIDEDSSDWCRAELPDVKATMRRADYPSERLHFVKGKVEDTIPGEVPESIALLRLDTDWYASTKHELEHLYPRLVSGGVLVLDDYGHWEGCRQAVDEYFDGLDDAPLLVRVDKSGRIAIKP